MTFSWTNTALHASRACPRVALLLGRASHTPAAQISHSGAGNTTATAPQTRETSSETKHAGERYHETTKRKKDSRTEALRDKRKWQEHDDDDEPFPNLAAPVPAHISSLRHYRAVSAVRSIQGLRGLEAGVEAALSALTLERGPALFPT